ncbi:MAG: recombinase family protein [Oscillospiraceae bacterium]|nr:recombinase family protein [Oscillospiraceae bacterium]
MQAAMYLRKSRAEENEPIQETLKRHKKILTSFSIEQSIEIIAVYEEVVSGDSLFSRPQILKLLEEAERYQAVLCIDIDRLGRGNMKEQGIILETLKNANVKIVTPNKTYDLNNELDETYSEFQAFMARQELKLIRSRMQRGIRKSAEEGSHMGPAPYGYKSARIGKAATLEIIPEEAEIVRQIFRMYTEENKGPGSISFTFRTQGITARKGGAWHMASIRRILSNQAYTGKVVYGKLMRDKKDKEKVVFRPLDEILISDGLHPAIIEQEVFDRAQTIRESRYLPPQNIYGEIKYPFAGLLKCSVCGLAMSRFPYKEYEYVLCRTRGCVRMCNMKLVERGVLSQLKLELDRITPIAPEARRDDELHISITVLQGEADRLNMQKQKLYEFLEDGTYTSSVFRERMSLTEKKITAALGELSRLQEKEKNMSKASQDFIPVIHSVLQSYDQATPAQKNEMLKKIIKRIDYYKGKEDPPKVFDIQVSFLDIE